MHCILATWHEKQRMYCISAALNAANTNVLHSGRMKSQQSGGSHRFCIVSRGRGSGTRIQNCIPPSEKNSNQGNMSRRRVCGITCTHALHPGPGPPWGPRIEIVRVSRHCDAWYHERLSGQRPQRSGRHQAKLIVARWKAMCPQHVVRGQHCIKLVAVVPTACAEGANVSPRSSLHPLGNIRKESLAALFKRRSGHLLAPAGPRAIDEILDSV
jgi:hypothetical protein